MTDLLNAKDREHLAHPVREVERQAWEDRPRRTIRGSVKLIDAGYLKRCDMRCGFEAFKDSGVTWTQAGRDAIAAMKEPA
jgi:hypothetical protein